MITYEVDKEYNSLNRRGVAIMWSNSICVLNPYEATIASLKKEQENKQPKKQK